jgi:hypothetical protein
VGLPVIFSYGLKGLTRIEKIYRKKRKVHKEKSCDHVHKGRAFKS